MEPYIACFMGGLLLNFFCVVCWNKLLNNKIDYHDYKIYLVTIILDLCGTIINFVAPHYLRVVCTMIEFFTINYIFFCKNITKNIIVVLFSYLILFASDFVLFLIINPVINNMESFSTSNAGVFILNAGAGIIAIMILKFSIVYKAFNYLLTTFHNMKRSNLVIYLILTFILISVFLIMAYVNLPPMALVICVVLLAFLFLIMLFRLANARENYRQINSKYETSITSLREKEDMMKKYRKSSHENKNQLKTIRNMIKPKDKKIADYIDKLLKEKFPDNETIFTKTSKIPEGGLRATIYSKLCEMESKKINYNLNISNEVETSSLIEIGDYTMINICKIMGVFLDNAIESVENIKESNIIIEMFVMDEKLCIDVSNNYEGKLELNKLYNKGYTTKGKGHGYGLPLVKDILKEDDNLEHEMEINKNMFTQRLIIKM